MKGVEGVGAVDRAAGVEVCERVIGPGRPRLRRRRARRGRAAAGCSRDAGDRSTGATATTIRRRALMLRQSTRSRRYPPWVPRNQRTGTGRSRRAAALSEDLPRSARGCVCRRGRGCRRVYAVPVRRGAPPGHRLGHEPRRQEQGGARLSDAYPGDLHGGKRDGDDRLRVAPGFAGAAHVGRRTTARVHWTIEPHESGARIRSDS